MVEAPLGLYMCADYLFHFFFKMAAVHFKMVTAECRSLLFPVV